MTSGAMSGRWGGAGMGEPRLLFIAAASTVARSDYVTDCNCSRRV